MPLSLYPTAILIVTELLFDFIVCDLLMFKKKDAG